MIYSIASFNKSSYKLQKCLTELGSQRHILIKNAECYGSVLIMKSGHKTFGHKGTDLFFRKVNHSDNQPTNEFFGVAKLSNLDARLAHPNLFTKIDIVKIYKLKFPSNLF